MKKPNIAQKSQTWKPSLLPTALCVLGLLLAGCTTRIVDFTLLSTKNVDLQNAQHFQRGMSRAHGESIAHIIVFVPTAIPNLKEAVDKAIESIPGCVALVDGVVYQRTVMAIVYGQNGFIVEGTPLIDTTLLHAGTNPDQPIYKKVVMDTNNTVKSVTDISAEEYQAFKSRMAKGVAKKLDS